ncbi:MAG: UDP-3-O-acyl-N-acetylglucosamine deacetylase [Nitrospirae bacterium]|nr:UDP-3-O-acyl-N-acetylglucosamine deacetylase [Nitrospirota bacterium]
MRLQRTLKKEVSIAGIGLHTGQSTSVKLMPAPRDNGIVFYRRDRDVFIKADLNSVSDTAFATTLGSNGTKVKTVEHILAALSGLGIDNLLIEVSGPEIPILDGSSSGFVELILSAGVAKQAEKMPHLRILKPVFFKEANTEICVLPYDGTLITYQASFDHNLIGRQKMSIRLNEETFVKELAPARTFGFLKDIANMRANGLAKGGSLENAIILSDIGVVNKTGLRFQDEFIRHKVLDFIGDISLIGLPVYGHIHAIKTGHTTNIKFAKKLLSSEDCWEIVSEHSLSQVAYN